MAIFLAVQTAFPAAALYTEEIFGIYTEEKSGFFDDLEFGDNDWAALCYIRLYGTEGAEEYLSSVERSAEQLMNAEGFVKPTELQRAAIVLSAAGRCGEELINAAVYGNDKLHRQGMNAYVWGLIAANCSSISAPENAINTTETLTEYLLSKQLADGGFSLKGSAADTDMTASAIYALAPHRAERGVSAALDRAEQCLRALQLQSGGYSSIGIENCESTAQAIIAFASLGYGREDGQVSKALEALLSYRRGSGYAHLPEGGEDGIATVQALIAFTALELSEEGKALYDVWDIPQSASKQTFEAAVQTNEAVVPTEEISAEASEIQPEISGNTVKYIISAVAAAFGVILAVVLLVSGKKKLLIIPVLLFAAGAAVLLMDIRTPEEYYSSEASGGITVTVTVDCSAALSHDISIELPESGMLLSECSTSVSEGASAFDALIEAAKAERLPIDHTGSVFGEYVSGIGGLYEFDCGSESGWLYNVNGKYPSVSAGAYIVSDGDVIEFVYTDTLGTNRQ